MESLLSSCQGLVGTNVADHRRWQAYGAQAVVVSIDPRRVYVKDPADTQRPCLRTSLRGPQGQEYCWWQCTVKVGSLPVLMRAWLLGVPCQLLSTLSDSADAGGGRRQVWAACALHACLPLRQILCGTLAMLACVTGCMQGCTTLYNVQSPEQVSCSLSIDAQSRA